MNGSPANEVAKFSSFVHQNSQRVIAAFNRDSSVAKNTQCEAFLTHAHMVHFWSRQDVLLFKDHVSLQLVNFNQISLMRKRVLLLAHFYEQIKKQINIAKPKCSIYPQLQFFFYCLNSSPYDPRFLRYFSGTI